MTVKLMMDDEVVVDDSLTVDNDLVVEALELGQHNSTVCYEGSRPVF